MDAGVLRLAIPLLTVDPLPMCRIAVGQLGAFQIFGYCCSRVYFFSFPNALHSKASRRLAFLGLPVTPLLHLKLFALCVFSEGWASIVPSLRQLAFI